jgi:hypothetical protein
MQPSCRQVSKELHPKHKWYIIQFIMSASPELLSVPAFDLGLEAMPQDPFMPELDAELSLTGDTIDTLAWTITHGSIGIELGILDETLNQDPTAPMLGSLALGHNEVIDGVAPMPDSPNTRAFGDYVPFGFGELDGLMGEDAIPGDFEYEATEPGEPQGVMAELLIPPEPIDELRTSDEQVPMEVSATAGIPPEEALVLAA